MAAPGRSFVINLLGNSSGAEKAFGNVGKAAGRLPGPVGIATAAITASFAAVVAVVGKVTKELFDLGQEFDDVYDDIRIQTGITGSALAELQDSFRDVARQVPNDFADIGIAIQDLNTRLGVTGEPLEDLALQLLTVTRLMGGDIQTNVRNTTRLFGDFGVAAEDQAGVLDLLFRASQQSGQSFEVLAEQVVSSGADLRLLGFGLEESVAMLALFERTGVNTETVMSGLRVALGKMAAEAGTDIPTAFRDFVQSVADAETQTEALGIATELLSGRYAGNFVDTIRGGKFDLDELVESISNGSETIQGAADDTDGFREAWQNFKNYLKLQFEGPATAVFEGLEGVIEELIPAVDRVKAAFEEDGLEGALAQVAEEWDKIYEENIKPLWDQFLLFLDETVKPLAIAIAKEIGAAMWDGLKTAFTDGLKRGLLGDGERESLLSESERLRLEALRGGSERPDVPGATNAPTGGRVPEPPRPTPPPRPSPSSGPSGSGEPGRGGFTVPRPAGIGGGISFFAEGGIVTSPVLGMVGEAGPEAIIPLDRAGELGGPTTINITVTSADPQAVVEALRRYTRNNGPLGQVVSV